MPQDHFRDAAPYSLLGGSGAGGRGVSRDSFSDMGSMGSNFYDLLRSKCPHLLPDFSGVVAEGGVLSEKIPRGTTILALKYKDGVIMAGDRMATEGYQVSHRHIEKIYRTDDFSAIAISGAAGPSIEMARLFQTEMEHYEKVEGEGLSLEGKANKLAQMIRQNLSAAIQGLVVIPIFAGYEEQKGEGRIFKYDLTGGRYEESEYHATGSGGKDARNTIKKLYRKDMERSEGVRVVLEALLDAAEEDVGTAGPDPVKGIYPSMKTITRERIKDVPEEEIKSIYEALIERRRSG
ncbi:proteasome beta subunit [Candidatus Hakubella thermalkaliphila]|uniref:Proteasome subunit beta n=1 Tax=Candidatus Hakubella thermalkaliphila TaxID=2754717 RepID=A0A6V8Q4U1_9ACTN|nr:proteasome subunit beta [Candidatus Hakubella thermalkaliphila]GFP19310.1 proteasome beta subunit [Candidatus Hakubella thermalkaliphila]GFP36730.1 proteasome beta subunit [Candidatus Hakubella thermalkaliphila]GFP39617.1 proteasome beta subunit [Candidatus Hakubella thermalkaliphila]